MAASSEIEFGWFCAGLFGLIVLTYATTFGIWATCWVLKKITGKEWD